MSCVCTVLRPDVSCVVTTRGTGGSSLILPLVKFEGNHDDVSADATHSFKYLCRVVWQRWPFEGLNLKMDDLISAISGPLRVTPNLVCFFSAEYCSKKH